MHCFGGHVDHDLLIGRRGNGADAADVIHARRCSPSFG